MKKSLYILIGLGLATLICVACFVLLDRSEETPPPTETTNLPTESIIDGLSQFMESMEGNVIDQDYIAESKHSSEADMVKIENKYMKIWSEELTYTYYYYYEVCNDTEKAELKKLQQEWVAQIEKEAQTLKEQQNVPDEQIQLACDAYYREQMRQRTLYLKYLLRLREEKTYFLYVPNKTVEALLKDGIFNYKDFEAYTTAEHCRYDMRFDDVSTSEKVLAAGEEVITKRYAGMLTIDPKEFAISLDEQAGVWMVYTKNSVLDELLWDYPVNYFVMIDKQTCEVLAVWVTMGTTQFLLQY